MKTYCIWHCHKQNLAPISTHRNEMIYFTYFSKYPTFQSMKWERRRGGGEYRINTIIYKQVQDEYIRKFKKKMIYWTSYAASANVWVTFITMGSSVFVRFIRSINFSYFNYLILSRFFLLWIQFFLCPVILLQIQEQIHTATNWC